MLSPGSVGAFATVAQPRCRRWRPRSALFVGISVIATVLALAPPPADAAAQCGYEQTAFGDTITVRTDVDVELSVRGDMLLVNGAACGELTQVASVFSTGPVDLFVDFSADWDYPGGRVPTTLNIFDMTARSRITFLGGSRGEQVTWESADVAKPRGYAAMDFRDRATQVGILSVVIHERSRASLEFRLGGGRDRYTFANERYGYRSSVRIHGGPGRDRIVGGPGRQRIVGGAGDDVLIGGPGDDRIHGRGGRDVVEGGAGADQIFGGDGREVADGGPGRDDFFMTAGKRDRVDGGPGVDVCTCDPGDRQVNI